MPPTSIARKCSVIAILGVFACPLMEAQTRITNGAEQLPVHQQSGGGWIALGQPGPADPGTAASQNGWVRGSGSLNKTTGVVDFCLRMATDSLKVGPKARMGVVLRDSNDRDLATLSVGEIGRGGREHSVAENDVDKFCGQTTVSPDIAARATSVGITVQVTGVVTKRLGVGADDTIEASRIAVGERH